jgi:hypothetical protein
MRRRDECLIVVDPHSLWLILLYKSLVLPQQLVAAIQITEPEVFIQLIQEVENR